jgi:hypothetical protein
VSCIKEHNMKCFSDPKGMLQTSMINGDQNSAHLIESATLN